MITCTYCGNENPDTRRECQYCGAPLSQGRRSEYGAGVQPSMQPAQPQQSVQSAQPTQSQASELPAWLQSLRSDAPVRSSEQSNFSAAEFMEESDLPRWMQPNSGPDEEPDEETYEHHGKQGMQGTGSLRPSSFPGPTTDEGYVRNISAHDLIDEQMLPDWMKSNGGGASDAPLADQRHISASGLIQQDSVPDWMRNFPQEQPGTPQSAPTYQEHAQQGFNASPSPAFSAHDLIDQQSLPPWLREQSGQGNQGSQDGQQRQQVGSNSGWNAAQQQQMGEPARHLAASSLIDMNALPSWMSEANMSNMSASSQQPMQQQYPVTPSSQVQGQAMWQNMPPQQQTQQQTPSQQAGLSAASFIDMNALPDWLRASSEMGQPAMQNIPASSVQGMNGAYGVQGQAGQQGQQGQQGQNYGSYGTNGVQQRAENVRVPSRPRGDIGMNEGNEAAANAFSSVLGVASHAPQFTQGTPYTAQPAQQPSPAYPARPVQSASPASPMSSTRPSPQQYPNDAFTVQSPLNMGQGQQATYMNNIGVAQVPPMGAQPVGGPQSLGQPVQGAMPYNQMQHQQNHMQGQSAQQRLGQPNQPNQEKAQKRGGLFEAIRNFFFRQS